MLVSLYLYLSPSHSPGFHNCHSSQEAKRIMAIKSEIKVLFIWSEGENGSREHVNFIYTAFVCCPGYTQFIILLGSTHSCSFGVLRFFNYRLVIN